MKRTEMNKISKRKLAQLAAEGKVVPASTLTSKPKLATTRRQRKDTGPDAATVDAVLERDGHQCVVCGGALYGTRSLNYSIHHRKLRSQGGDHRTSNLIAVCGHGTSGCHGDIHGAPAKAEEAGWIVLSTDDPAKKVMAHSLHGYVLLDNEGAHSTSRRVAS